tara:strand:+ start:2905 stop:4164 length:1260 start_codon:yes stop_codon:yes gene_type:complete
VISKTNKLLEELTNLHPKYIDLSLSRLRKLLKKLKDPHLSLPKTIHIAGTNGKGSIQSFIRKILISNGYTCDAYISPHLTKFNERIILNNKEVSTRKLNENLNWVKKINNKDDITFFEITTAVAFVLFSQTKSDFLILETGLGGRLDATNIIPNKLCSIITPISYDHEEFLGNTIKKITREKLGIVNKSNFIIISKQKKEVRDYIKNRLIKKNNVYFYGRNFIINKLYNNKFEFKFNRIKKIFSKPKLNGLHQIENAAVALAFSEIISKQNIKLKFRNVNRAIRNTVWPGRLEILNYKDKKIILDGSHNIDGAKKLKEYLEYKKIKPIVLFGMLNNKKIDNFLKIIKSQISSIFAIKIPNEKNAFHTNEIAKKCSALSINCKEIKNVSDGLKQIINTDDKFILITGSLYLVGKIRIKFL